MSTVYDISPALAGEFNTAFHDRPQFVQTRMLAVLKAVLAYSAAQNVSLPDAHLVAGIDAAFDKVKRKPDLNLVTYAFSTAHRRQQRDVIEAAESEHEGRKSEALTPIGVPVVRVAGAPIPAPGLPENVERIAAEVMAECGLTQSQRERVRATLTFAANGWRATPDVAWRSITRGLCAGLEDRGFNAFGYVVEEIEALEASGVNCTAPPTDPFLAHIEREMAKRHDATPKARKRFLDVVRLLADSPQ